MTWTSEQRARLTDVIRTHWWQGKDPPKEGHHIGRDLSVCKRWVEQGEDPDELAEVLALYNGPPATLLVPNKRGLRHVLEELRGRHHKQATHPPRKRGSMERMEFDVDKATGEAA